MITEERQQKILDLLAQRGSISVNELSHLLFASTATIRRDLAHMENNMLLKRTHGGAIPFSVLHNEAAVSLREQISVKEKRIIANIAIKYIKSNDILFLDSSTTISALIPFLSVFKDQMIITTGLKNATLLSEQTNAKICIPGGMINQGSNTILSSDTINYINNLYIHTAIFSCGGISEYGITDRYLELGTLMKAVISRSKNKILLCDSSKFGKTFIVRTCNFSDIDLIITDKKPDNIFIEAANKDGCKIIWN